MTSQAVTEHQPIMQSQIRGVEAESLKGAASPAERWLSNVVAFLATPSGPTVVVGAVGAVIAFLSYRHGVHSKKRELDTKEREISLAERKHKLSDLILPPNIQIFWTPNLVGTKVLFRFKLYAVNASNKPITISHIRVSRTGFSGWWGASIRSRVGGKKLPLAQVRLEPTEECELLFDADGFWVEKAATRFRRVVELYQLIFTTKVTVVLTTGESTGVYLPEDFIASSVNSADLRSLRLALYVQKLVWRFRRII